MAEPAESSTSNTDSNVAPAPPSQQDWEMLSMSMSASTYGTPGSAPVICICDFCTGKVSSPPPSCLAARSISNLPPSVAPEGAEKSFTKGFAVENTPADNELDEAVQDEGSPLEVGVSAPEPFTEGWKPRCVNSPADLIIDLAPATLRQYPVIPDTIRGDRYEKDESSIDKAVYAVDPDAGILIDEGCVDSPSNSSLIAEGKKVKNKSLNAWPSWLWKVQARDARTLWSFALAASVVGIVVLGYRWHRERCQNQQLRMQLSAQDEKIGDLHHQVTRLKDMITGRRRVHVTRASY